MSDSASLRLHDPFPYAELHCKTNFSFLEGASHADELVGRAAELGYRVLAITDRNSLSGMVRAHVAAKEHGLPLIVGAELTPLDALPLVVWVPDRSAYANLCLLLTDGRRRAPKGECHLYLADIARYARGLIAGVIPQRQTTVEQLEAYRELFAEAYLLAELHLAADDDRWFARLQKLASASGLPLVAAGDVMYHVADRMFLYDVLTAIRTGTTVERIGELRHANAQRHLRSLPDLRAAYRDYLPALQRTAKIAQRCRFSLEELRYDYPVELAPAGITPLAYLKQLTWAGAQKRYPQGIPVKVRKLLEHELVLIEELHFEAYFLTVWDLVRFARSRQILCQGRGSAANSSVCYCLGITAVDPERMDLLFERFVSRERDEAPDIDVDFEHERREEVLQYIYDKYGRDRAGMTAVVISYRMRSAIRDAGKALGLSLDRVNALAKQIDGYASDDRIELRCQQVGLDPQAAKTRQFLDVLRTLVGFPRHLSQHVGGMVMTQSRLSELVPIENAAMEGRTVICWDKNDLDALGILKVDCLGLGMLGAIQRAFQLIAADTGQQWTLASVPAEDPQVYEMVSRADTIGVFQIESRAQMSMLPRLQPRCFYDLVIEVAIVRPGPIQGQMVHPYLRRRNGLEQVTYANEDIRRVLEKTLGVPIFQEQAMRLAVVAAGFTPGEADQLRRAMGAWRRPGIIDQFREKLISGMCQRGFSAEFATQVFQQIRGFGEYGFPESHAASFALLVYVSAWLKRYYPAAFAAAIINSQPMGFYAPAQLIRDAQQHGVEVLPIDVNDSDWDCSLQRSKAHPQDSIHSPQLRLGMRLIVGLSEQSAERIRDARQLGRFSCLEDFTRRTQLNRSVVACLADADAFASFGRDRRQALWESLAQPRTPQPLPLFDQLQPGDEGPAPLPELEPQAMVFADYRTTGLTLRQHPLAFHRQVLQAKRVLTADQLKQVPHNRLVRVAGLVLLRQRPSTAKGITFATLEDETGTANLVLHQAIWERYYTVAKRSPAWVAVGRLEAKYNVIHVVVSKLEDFAEFVQAPNPVAHRSRDFR